MRFWKSDEQCSCDNTTFLKRWLALGPIPLTQDEAPDEEAQKKAFETHFLATCGGEAQVFAKTPPACSVGGHALTWKSVESPSEVVDLAKEVGKKDHAVAYALAELESRTATSVIGFCSQLSRYPSEHLTVVVLDSAYCSLPGLIPHKA